MALQRVRTTIWLAWIMLATAIFTIMPVGPYGITGWIGAAAPLARGLLPFLNRWRLVAVATAAMALAFLLSETPQWFEIAFPVAALLIGVALTPVVPNGSGELLVESRDDDRRAQREFDAALIRELGRARRYGRPLTVFSAVRDDDQTDLGPLREAIGTQIHIYCQMAMIDGRLLVIVPELGPRSCLALEQRIIDSIRRISPGEVSLGRASFPGDAVSGAGLIRVADANRRAIAAQDTDGAAPRPAVESAAHFESELSAP